MRELSLKTETGVVVPAVTGKEHQELLAELYSNYKLKPVQLSESAAFSLAMVVRFALGLSSVDGRVCILANESLTSSVALAAARHLVINGSQVVVLVCGEESQSDAFLTGSSQARSDLAVLEHLGVQFHTWHSSEQHELVQEVLQQCHNVVCGLFNYATVQTAFEGSIIELLNELSTPVHSIGCPLGISPDSGDSLGEELFASSTLSLGLPLNGVVYKPDNAGRQYLCDISLPQALREKIGVSVPPLFAEQPVCKLLPNTQDGEEAGTE